MGIFKSATALLVLATVVQATDSVPADSNPDDPSYTLTCSNGHEVQKTETFIKEALNEYSEGAPGGDYWYLSPLPCDECGDRLESSIQVLLKCSEWTDKYIDGHDNYNSDEWINGDVYVTKLARNSRSRFSHGNYEKCYSHGTVKCSYPSHGTKCWCKEKMWVDKVQEKPRRRRRLVVLERRLEQL